ncbi:MULTISPECIES: MFS transporter [unclassified Methylophilus]|uniref:MFS transporter n=1 Tax=unclassified Methylophilus TaxID=2630143 RepID=UPI0006FF2448|nr:MULTISPECIES: MFS transporter [unclassified Methylophilus]KQT43872.1 MFS transporter [Methylophilus sp. Leaf416]KQT59356.1 MFS transporter [Methylophilus sp. Leaf459]
MPALNSNAARLATRLAFFVGGFGLSCWAPLIPFMREKLHLDPGVLGTLLLCLGLGSVSAMVMTGAISARFGSRAIIILSGFSLAMTVMLLPVAESTLQLAITLLFFGASLGSLDVSMNLHAVEVEKASECSLMSGFHAMFSVGGFAGSAIMTLMLSLHMTTFSSALGSAILLAVLMLATWPRLSQTPKGEQGQLFSLPRGIVLILALLTGIAFLVEGAMLDWSALLITDTGLVPTAQGGLPYIVFSIAMLSGRFMGDGLSNRLGDRTVLLWGGIIAVLGMFIAVHASSALAALTGFLLIGAGASNTAPILFRLAGAQTQMPTGLAVAAISTVGYSGVLLGPALIGFVAQQIGLPNAFIMLALLLGLVPVFSFMITKK